MKMKNTLYLLTVLALLAGACDKIDEPYLVPTGGNQPGPDEKTRKILLEEFTGHLCVNCPEATRLARDLKQVYGEQLVLLTLHAGDLSLPGNPPYDADYRTEAGTAIFNFYDPVGVPTGLVNRKPYEGGTVLFKDNWEPAILELKDIPPDASIEIAFEYEETSRKLDLHIHTEFLNDLDGQYNISVFITESMIVSAQKNDLASLGPTPDWLDYEHSHLLREAVSGTWGDLLLSQPPAGAIMVKDYSLILDNNWNVHNCGVVAIITDADTYEVIQAEEVHLH